MTEINLPSEPSGREMIAFLVGDQEYCVDIMAVREIRGWCETTPLPHAPTYVRGMINLRGTVLPVLDMGVRLGLPAAEATSRHVVIVVNICDQLVGLLVDGVCDILTVAEGAVQPTPDLAGDPLLAVVVGLIALDERMIGLVALEQLLPNLEAEAA
jgi:purine-binding chemotaxis protein CheW